METSHGLAGRGQMAIGRRKMGRFQGPHAAAGLHPAQLDHPGRQPRPDRPRRLQGGGRALSPLHRARLPVGAPHRDLPRAQGPAGHDRPLRHALADAGERLDLRSRARRRPRHGERRALPLRALCQERAGLQRPRHRAGAVGQEDVAHREQRIRRHHPHAEQRVRRHRRDARRLLSGGHCAARSTRVNKRVYDTLNNGVYKAGFAGSQEAYDEAVVPVFETLDWLEERLSRAALSRRRPPDRGGLAPVHDAAALRSGLSHPLQVQPEAPGGLPSALGLHAPALPAPGGRGRRSNFDHIKGHYFQSHRWINPTGIVPKGPIVDFDAPVDYAHGQVRTAPRLDRLSVDGPSLAARP